MPLESCFLNQEFCFQKEKVREQMNMIMLIIILSDFYNQAVYYNCFCGWYKIFKQIFKPVGDLLNISDCYYRLSFIIYGWFICIRARTHSQASILLWKCYPVPDSTLKHLLEHFKVPRRKNCWELENTFELICIVSWVSINN